MATFAPTIAPSDGYNLPPQAAPLLTLAPTIDGSTTKNPAIQFRITALAFLFSISGILFTLILIHQSVVFLLKKRWDQDDISKWELDHQNEERKRLMEEGDLGNGKFEKGTQFYENDLNDRDIKRLDPSWIREKDFSMQWEDPSQTSSKDEKVLIARRWNEQTPSSGPSRNDDHGGSLSGGKKARVMKKNKRIQPNTFEKGCEVIVRTTDQSQPLKKGTLPPLSRPARIISSFNGVYEVEYTDSEGGIGNGITSNAIHPVIEFNIEITKN